jgi:hypothetical protein
MSISYILLYSFFFIFKKGPDPSPYEFPIFNVSHNPLAPYPNPINHLYDKRYKEAYSTFIKPNPPASTTSQQNEPSTPTSPSSSQPTTNTNSPPYPTYPQGQYQQQSNKQAPPPIGFTPAFRQQPVGGWQYVNPYATMPRSHAAYYQQQASKVPPPIQEQPSTNNTQPLRRSSTGEDLSSHSLSRSENKNELNYSTNSGAEKIRVRVINDNSVSSSTDPQTNTFLNNHPYAQRSILKSNNGSTDNKEIVPTRTIYTSPNTEIGSETMEDLLKVVNNQQSTSSPGTERIIIIDRRGASTSDNNPNSSGMDRFRTFEIRTSSAGPTPSTPPITSTATTSNPTPTTSTSSAAYAMQQPNYYTGQRFFYQQPKMYMSLPNNLYSATTPYVAGANNFYPFGYYYY